MCKRNAELNKQAIALMQKKAQGGEEKKDDTATPKDKNTPDQLIKLQQENVKSKKLDKEMQEALKIAQELERQEEEEMMRRALEESSALE
jgi:hypothetical protein